MLETVRTIQSFIETSNVLKHIGGRWYNCRRGEGVSYKLVTEEDISFGSEELICLDERVPFVLTELARQTAEKGGIGRHEHSDGCPVVPGALVRATLKYWNNEVYIAPIPSSTILFEHVGMVLPETSTPNIEYVPLNVKQYIIGSCNDDDGVPISFVKQGQYNQHHIQREWLNKTFPDWDKRLLVAESLGYRGPELLNYVFVNIPTQVMPINVTGTLPDTLTYKT